MCGQGNPFISTLDARDILCSYGEGNFSSIIEGMDVQQNTMVLFGALLLSMFVFYYTGSREESRVKTVAASTEKQLSSLEESLDGNNIKNALILKAYAEQLKKNKPEFSTLADQLSLDATSKGPAVTALKERLKKASDTIEDNGSSDAVMRELLSIQNAANSGNYNDFLLGNINVIASLSGGSLPAINPAGGNQGSGAEQLVGNPQYGQWRQHNGMSVWEWYGAFAMLRDLVGGGRPYYYQDWARSPAFSDNYYGSYGGGSGYAAPQKSYKAANDNVRQEKTYGASQERRRSSYGVGSGSSSRRSVWGGSRRSSSFGSFRRRK